MNWELVDPVAIIGYTFLGVAIVAFATGVFTRRTWLAVAGTLIAAPICFLLSLLYAVAPVLPALAVNLANLLSTWMLYRSRRLAAAMLLLPFAAMVLMTAVTVPLVVSTEITANVSLGDLDGDGDLDVVLAKGRHKRLVNVVLLNDGKGHFEQTALSETADKTYSVPLADLDGDGDLDIVVGNDFPDKKLIYLNDGKAHFTLEASFGDADWATRNVTLSDLNGDGRPDFVVANRDGRKKQGASYICLNDGRGHFPSCRVLSEGSATRIVAGDLNGDGAPDLVVPRDNGGQSYVFINDGKGGFDKRRPFGPARVATRAIALGDLNGDGRLDIITGNDAPGGALVYFNEGSAVFSDAVLLGEKTDDVYAIEVADLNGDGEADVALGIGSQQWWTNSGTVAILLNNGKGRAFTFLRLGDNTGAVYGLAIGDLNGDGSLGIVAARSGAPSMICLNSLIGKARPTEGMNLVCHRLTGSVR
jgi:hypothetical protein